MLKDTLGDTACHGAPFVLLPTFAMTADKMVTRHFPEAGVEVTTPLFANEEIIFANSGVLLHCPGMLAGAGRAPLDSFPPAALGRGARLLDPPRRPTGPLTAKAPATDPGWHVAERCQLQNNLIPPVEIGYPSGGIAPRRV